jgi:hypothetical protein
VTRLACLVCLALLAVSAAGCVEMSRRDVHRPPEIIGDGIRIRKPVAASLPRTEGLEGARRNEVEGFYRVAKTDSLVSIAERFYGDRSFVRELQERNRDILTSVGCTRGTVIALPKVARKARDRGESATPADPVAAASAALDAAQFGRPQTGPDAPLPDFTDFLPPDVGARQTPAPAPAAPQAAVAPVGTQGPKADTKK